MDLLIQINGKKDIIIDSNKLDINNLDIIKIDEKDLAKPKKIIRLINSKKYDNVLYGCVDLEFQRFQYFMKLYIFLSKVKKGRIIDESGNVNEFRLAKFIFKETPNFKLELFISFFTVIFYYFKIPYLKIRLKKLR